MAEMAPDVKSVLRNSWRVMEMPAGAESLPETEKEELEKPALLLEEVREKTALKKLQRMAAGPDYSEKHGWCECF